MYKRVLIALAALALIITAGIYLLKSSNQSNEVKLLDISCIPINAICIVESHNAISGLNSIVNQNEVFEKLAQTELFNYNTSLAVLDSLIQRNSAAKKYFKNKTTYLSIHPRGVNKIGVLFSFTTGSSQQNDSLQQFISSYKSDSLILSKNYDGAIISQLAIAGGIYNATIYKNYFLVSQHITLIEDAVRQINSKISLINNEVFKKAYQTKGNKGLGTLFLNLEQFPFLAKDILTPATQISFNRIENFCQWIALDIDNVANSIVLKGFSAVKDSLKSYLSIFRKQEPVAIDLYSVIPDNVSFFSVWGVSNQMAFNQSYKSYLRSYNLLQDNEAYFKKVKRKTGLDVERLLINEWSSQLAHYSIESKDAESANYMVLQVKDVDKFVELTTAIVDSLSADSIPKVDTIHYQTYPIYSFPLPEYFNYYLQSSVPNFKCNYFTVISNEYVVFSASIDNLKNCIESYVASETFVGTYYYKNYFSKKYNSDCNFLTYYSSAFFIDKLKTSTVLNYATNVTKAEPLLKEFYPLAFQFSNTSKLMYSYAAIGLKDSLAQTIDEYWKINFDTTITKKPVAIYNHSDKREDVFVQDNANKIYWVNCTGEIAWQMQLKDSIVGNVIQIDAYKNNKLQLLFATKNEIHLIDKNGNYLKGYPFKVKSTIVSNLITYNKKRETLIGFVNSQNELQSFKISSVAIEKHQSAKIGFAANYLTAFNLSDGTSVIAATDPQHISFVKNFKQVIHTGNLKNSIISPILLSEKAKDKIEFCFVDANFEYNRIDLFSGKHISSKEDVFSDVEFVVLSNANWLIYKEGSIIQVDANLKNTTSQLFKKKLESATNAVEFVSKDASKYCVSNNSKTALYLKSSERVLPTVFNGKMCCIVKSFNNSYQLITLQKDRKLASFRLEE
ncbi:MAG: hypothetical protein J0M08_11015 [Bacteroidetes bacterium]|nr:hypothetical protein [Bacteroidota bacterium]